MQICLKMAKTSKNPKLNKEKNSKAKEKLIEENKKLQILKKSIDIEQRDLRRETRELKKRIQQKIQERDYLLYLRTQRNEALAFHFANPA